ncbi:MAG TPA: hypothetical protein VH682_14435 [Gemmataceae bacterium]|jgi:hypothetical protein
MAYFIKYERNAKAELTSAQDCYGGQFRVETNAWLQEIAAAAERRDYAASLNSVDLVDILKTVLDSPRRSWPYSWRRWVKAPIRQKFQATLILIHKRCPPWEIRVSERSFTVIDAFSAEVTAVFEVDHVQKRVIFRMFHGLPGQG